LAAALEDFETHRDRYPDLEAYTPKLVEAFRGWAARAPAMAADSRAEIQARQGVK
jgi:hypothetical protein